MGVWGKGACFVVARPHAVRAERAFPKVPSPFPQSSLLLLALGVTLLAGAFEAVHGRAAGGPELKNFGVHHGGEDLFHVARSLVREYFKKVVEIKLAFSGLPFEEVHNFLLFVGHRYPLLGYASGRMTRPESRMGESP